MTRPKYYDQAINEDAANLWIETNEDKLRETGFFNDVISKDRFKTSLLRITNFQSFDYEKALNQIVHEIKVPLSFLELSEIIEEYLDFRDTTHEKAVREWVVSSKLQKPFDTDYARVITKGASKHTSYQGIAEFHPILSQEGKIQVFSDENRTDPYLMGQEWGLFSSSYVIPWEEIVEVLPLTEEDEKIINDYQAKMQITKAKASVQNAIHNSQGILADLIKKSREENTLDDYITLANKLDFKNEEIPTIIAALTRVYLYRNTDKTNLDHEVLQKMLEKTK